MTPESARSLRDDAGNHFRTTSDPSARSTPAAPPVINRTDALRCRIADLARKTKHGACQQPSASFVVATGRHGAAFRRFAVGMDDEVQYRRGASSISPFTASPCRFSTLSRPPAGDLSATRNRRAMPGPHGVNRCCPMAARAELAHTPYRRVHPGGRSAQFSRPVWRVQRRIERSVPPSVSCDFDVR